MKVVLQEIHDISELKGLIEIGFRGDESLLNYLHISPGTLEHCVSHTYDTILKYYYDNVYKGDVHMYSVTIEADGVTKPIGFTVTITEPSPMPHNLLSYAINIEWRSPEILQAWLDNIENILTLPFFTGIHTRNIRAEKFWLKHGFIKEAKEGYNLMIKYEICQ